MNTQPKSHSDVEALRLADALENWPDIRVDLKASAAELRRLYGLSIQLEEELNATERQVEILSDELSKCSKANAELLVALKNAEELIGMEPFEHTAQEAADAHKNIRAASAKAESLYKHSKENT